jgi:hypothetical protein
MTKRNPTFEAATQKAMDAFWQVILEFPLATTGDLSIDLTIRFDIIAYQAVVELIHTNVPGYKLCPTT